MSTLPISILLDVLYLLLAPFVLAYVLVVSRLLTRPKYRRGLLGKLGQTPARQGGGPALWVHAVSVGEVLTAKPLVKALEERFPTWDLSISVSTFTGFEVARRNFPERTVFYFPLDVTAVLSRVFRRRRPAAVVLVELEVWPNFLLASRRRQVPVFVVNGRMTERSCIRYERARWIGRFFFRQLKACAVQNEAYASRFRRVGVPPERISVLGNLKHDRSPAVSTADGQKTRQRLGWSQKDSVVLVAGCTHPAEEAMLCSLVKELRATESGLRLVLAPRHIERLVPGEVESWGSDRPLVRWSDLQSRPQEDLGEATLVVDTVGDLERFYAAADLAVVGGSFVPHGGHNLLEPAKLGRPLLFGPHHQNFEDEAAHLLDGNGAVCCRDEAELKSRLFELLRSPALRRELGERAQRAATSLEGAAVRHADWLARWLPDGE